VFHLKWVMTGAFGWNKLFLVRYCTKSIFRIGTKINAYEYLFPANTKDKEKISHE